MNPSSTYAYLDGNDKGLQKVISRFPVPAGLKGTVNQIDTWADGAFKKTPYAELAKGLLEYRAAQRTHSFTGIAGIHQQDQAVTEAMGPIIDRTQEHLGSSDACRSGGVILPRGADWLDATKDLRRAFTSP
jgi:hypothetical protein